MIDDKSLVNLVGSKNSLKEGTQVLKDLQSQKAGLNHSH